jgi:hypothetical protein
MSKKKENQYHHFVSKFLLKNFKNKRSPIYKYENEICTPHNIEKTGGSESLYSPSLEIFFSKLENIISAIINKHIIIDNKDKAYMKIFILSMAYRSPSKNHIISEEYENYQNILKNEIPLDEDRYFYLKNIQKKQNSKLMSLEDDLELKKILELFPTSFDTNEKSSFYSDLTVAELQLLPKIGKYFDVHIFESEYDLIIGETPTISVDVVRNEVKTNGEEAGILNKNAIFWIPIAYNKIALMYRTDNIVVTENSKLNRQDANILNYFQREKSPFFYSRISNIEIFELPADFNFMKQFNHIFEYKIN